jgi:hypothetical protein
MRYYPAGCPGHARRTRGGGIRAPRWHASLQGRQGMLPAIQRTHDKVVAMRSRITRRLVIAVLAVPAIDAHAPGSCLFCACCRQGTPPTRAMTHKMRRSW